MSQEEKDLLRDLKDERWRLISERNHIQHSTRSSQDRSRALQKVNADIAAIEARIKELKAQLENP